MVQIVQKYSFFKCRMPFSMALRALVCAILVTSIAACGRAPATSAASESGDISISKETSRMKKARDFNPKNMFGEDKASEGERLDRLERMVQTLRNDFDNVSPSIKRLMVLEGDLQTLIAELQEITQIRADQLTPSDPNAPQTDTMEAAPSAPPVMASKAPTGRPKIYNKTPPSYAGGAAAVYDVRVGEHKNKTRIVIDVNAKTPHSVSIDNSEGIMVVELPQASWEAAKNRNYRKSGFLNAYTVQAGTDGATGHFVIFQLKRDAKLSYEKVLPALSGGGAQRIVLDLTAGYMAGAEDK